MTGLNDCDYIRLEKEDIKKIEKMRLILETRNMEINSNIRLIDKIKEYVNNIFMRG